MQKKWGLQPLENSSNKIEYFRENRLIFVLSNIKTQDESATNSADEEEKNRIKNLAIKIQKQHGGPWELALRTAEAETKVGQVTRENIELRLLAESAKEMAEKDKLTGLSNRFVYMQKIQTEYSRFKRQETAEKEPVSLIMIDIDHFKLFNDKYGHHMGDKVLQEVGRILKENLPRDTDVIARCGGEEFFAVLPNTDQAGAALVAERLRKAVEKQTKELELPPVTISLGFTTLNKESIKEFDSVKKMEMAADTALYHSKQNGRNRATQYKTGMKMPTQLEKLIKQLFYLEHDIARLQMEFTLKKRSFEIIQKSNELDVIDYERDKLKEIEEKILKTEDEIKKVELATEAEKLRAVA